jgi:tetratricopeptide (TPR) repeat protein
MTINITKVPFLDESRIKLVDGLLKVVDSADKECEARWVSIEAPSGWGKTRLIQELYQRLAARQEKQYWPYSILEATEHSTDDVMSKRKRTYPEPKSFNREKNALPEFMWLGVACESRGGIPSQVLLDDLQQLDAHSIYLEAAWSALASFKEKHFPTLAQAKQAVNDVMEEALSHGVGKFIEATASASLPGMGLVVKLGRLGIDRHKLNRDKNEILGSIGVLGESNTAPTLVDDTVSIISKLATPGLPTILFVEDLHKATKILETLIDRLVRLDASVIVITSTWPGEVEQRHILNATLKEPELASRCIRIQHDQPLSAPLFPEGASMGPLANNSMRGIIKAYYPKVEEKTLELLTARYNNPLPLELVCTLPIYARNFPDGDLALTEQEIAALPRSVEALYLELWKALPLASQQTLVLATMFIPEGRSEWDHELLKRVVSYCNADQCYGLLTNALEEETNPHGWTRTIEYWLKRFSEPDHRKIAQDSLNEFFRQQEIDQFLKSLIAEVSQTKLNIEIHTLKDQHTAWVILTLHQQGLIQNHEVVLIAIRVLQESLSEFPLEFNTLVALGKRLEKLEISLDSVEFLNGRRITALALGVVGRSKEALVQSNLLLKDQTRVLGPDAPDTFATRSNIALWLAKSGQFAEAVAQFNMLLKDQMRVLGPDAPQVLTTRNSIALGLAESGQIAEALVQFNLLLKDQTRVLGPDAPDTLTTRNLLAQQIGKQGRYKEAEEEYRALWEIQRQPEVRGEHHRDTLTARYNLAQQISNQGRYKEAEEEYRALWEIQRQPEVRGEHHRDTLAARHNLAQQMAQQGKYADAEKEFFTIQKADNKLDEELDSLRTKFWLAKCADGQGSEARCDSLLYGLETSMLKLLPENHVWIQDIRAFMFQRAKG